MFDALRWPATLLALLLVTPPLDAAFHFELARSEPAVDAHVEAPEIVTLWFTEVPQQGSVTVRLIDADGDLVEASAAHRDPDDGRSFSIGPASRLTPGWYTVAWRGIGSDGHTVRGDFRFMVTAQ